MRGCELLLLTKCSLQGRINALAPPLRKCPLPKASTLGRDGRKYPQGLGLAGPENRLLRPLTEGNDFWFARPALPEPRRDRENRGPIPVASHPLLAVGLAARIYSEPTVVTLTGDEAKSFLEDREVPSPPIPVPASATLRVAEPPKFPVEAGKLLEAWAPEVKSWLDLDLRGSRFESESDPGIARTIHDLVESNAGLRRVYEGLPP